MPDAGAIHFARPFPHVITGPLPQRSDRPRAGWLYAGVGLMHDDAGGDRRHVRALSLKLGPTGPASLAEEAQTLIHRRLSDSPRPLGWGNPLRLRLGVQLYWFDAHSIEVGKHFGGRCACWACR